MMYAKFRKLFPMVWAAICVALFSSAATAGPPFVTDDPQPTDYHKWEVYNFAGGSREGGVTSLDTGFDFNYGGFKDVQLTAVFPMHTETGAPLDAGDVQLAAKFKFLHQGERHFGLDVTFFPRVFVPTGRGSRYTQILLPLWVQRDIGKWQIFGGGGYTLNPGPGNRDYWVQGLVINRQVTKGFQLGVEEYHQGPGAIGDRPITGVNLGTTIHVKGPFSLLGAFGQGVNRPQTIFYTALKLDL
jgi:hypothetical protein